MRLCSIEFTSSGSFTVPAGVTSIIVLAQGGGGGGGGGAKSSAMATRSGHGGVATYLVPRVFSVVPNTTYTIIIGSGGSGGQGGTGALSTPGDDGGTTYFGMCVWMGGQGGPSGYQDTLSLGSQFVRGAGYFPIITDNLYVNNGNVASTYPVSIRGPIFSQGTPDIGGNPGLVGVFAPFGTPFAGAYGTPGPGGCSSDAGIGGSGGMAPTSSVAAGGNGGDAPLTSCGAGGGGGAGANTGTSGLPGNGGAGAPGRLIIIWAE